MHLEASVANMILIIVVCCVLYNICEAKGEYFHSMGAFQSLYSQPDFTQVHTTLGPQQTREIHDAVRSHVMEYGEARK